MPVSPILAIPQVASNQNQKEVTINDAVVRLEAATQASLAVAFASNAASLTVAQFVGNVRFACSGHTAGAALTVPLQLRLFLVANAGGFPIAVSGSSGAAVNVNPGETALVFCDGAGCSAAAGVPPARRDRARLLAQWVMGAVVSNGTFHFAYKAPYAGTVDSLDALNPAGGLTLTVQINGTTVGGLGAVAVGTAAGNTAAAGANAFNAGDDITGTVSGVSGVATGTVLNLNVTWSS